LVGRGADAQAFVAIHNKPGPAGAKPVLAGIAEIAVLNASNEPKLLLMAVANVPAGVLPPFGDITFQKSSWL
jgi:hypothetical protein